LAVVASSKIGGPYTKKEQIDRRDKVFKLHFEQSKSAVKISTILNVNRNTVNEDIKYWYKELSNELENFDKSSWLVRQIQRLESQRARLIEELENQDDFHNKIMIEKLLFDIDSKLANFVDKMNIPEIRTEIVPMVPIVPKDEEEEIKELVKFLLKSKKVHYTEDELLFESIKKYKYVGDEPEEFLDDMKGCGLELCKSDDPSFRNSNYYDLKKFAMLRGYFD